MHAACNVLQEFRKRLHDYPEQIIYKVGTYYLNETIKTFMDCMLAGWIFLLSGVSYYYTFGNRFKQAVF